MRLHLRSGRGLLLSVVLGLVALGCSADQNTAGAEASLPAHTPAPGVVTLDVSGVGSAPNLVMVSVIGKNVPTQPLASVCGLVDRDPYSFRGEYRPITGSDPCTLGPEPAELGPGTYEVIVAVMEGGSRSPEQCARTTIQVDGDVTVEVAGLGPPDGCGF